MKKNRQNRNQKRSISSNEKNIKKNEILYYDYNGEANNYNTKNFVHQKFLNE